MKLGKWIGWIAVAAAVVVCLQFRPTNLGGHTTFVTTHGVSMAPHFRAGDLAIVQPASSYRVGDVVAYRSATLHATLMHRIVAIDNGQFTFKGDNNDFLDPDHPTTADIVGRLRIRIPRGGAIRQWLVRPVVLVPLLALTLLAVATTASRRRKSRRHRGGSPPRREASVIHRFPTITGASSLGRVAPAAALIAAGGCLLAAVAVWNMPASRSTTRRVAYTQTAMLGYSGTAPVGATYHDGRIRTGDAVFTRLVDRVDINLSYDFTAAGIPEQAGGVYDVVAKLSSATGWKREIVLIERQAFAGARLRLSAPLELHALRDLQARFRAETGLATPAATLEVTSHLHATGEVGGVPVEHDIAPKLAFSLSDVEMQPSVAAGTTNAPADKGAIATQGGNVAVPTAGAAELTIWKLHLPGEVARLVSILLIALALGAGAAVMAADRKRTARGELARVLAKYDGILVGVDEIPAADSRRTVRVSSMRALVRLAGRHETLIVHADEPDAHRFAVCTDGGVVYCYDVYPQATPFPGPVIAPA